MCDFYHRPAGNLPEPGLSSGPQLVLREVAAGDEEFLFALFTEARGGSFAWLPPEQAASLLRMQFRAQQQSYSADFPGSSPALMILNGEKRAGVLWIAELANEYRIVDIAVAAAFQRRGIGSTLVRELLAAAHLKGKAVCASVAKTNAGSLLFHKRLGFRICGEDAVSYQLRAGLNGLEKPGLPEECSTLPD